MLQVYSPMSINRTKVELKQGKLSPDWSPHSTINRTKVELKLALSVNIPKAFPYQSYQSGIETRNKMIHITPYEAINRTKVELKQQIAPLLHDTHETINRTKVELKPKPLKTPKNRAYYQSYQSGIETHILQRPVVDVHTINRTKVELKQKYRRTQTIRHYYQSYQSGIETQSPYPRTVCSDAINRTKVELKQNSVLA